MADKDFIASPTYVRNGKRFKDIIWFSEDDGFLCRKIMNALGGKFTNFRDGVEVA